MKTRKIFWASFFIIAAVLLIISQLGYLGGINFVSLLLTILIAAIAVKSITSRTISVFLFCIAFLCIIYSGPLGLEKITPWPVLGAALLLSIGISILVKPKHRRLHMDDRFKDTVENDSGSDVYCDTHFASVIKYVESADFRHADISCRFGGAKIYFDKAAVRGGTGEIDVDVSFGGVELYIPKEWAIENSINAFAGGVDEKNHHDPSGDIIVRLSGRISFGGITIIYV